jgi:hypothetical protein
LLARVRGKEVASPLKDIFGVRGRVGTGIRRWFAISHRNSPAVVGVYDANDGGRLASFSGGVISADS